MSKESPEIYAYAQALSNDGGSEYWAIRAHGRQFDEITGQSEIAHSVRKKIDEAFAASIIYLGAAEQIECRVSSEGTALVLLRPTTFDVDGRISPIIIVFNAFSDIRKDVATVARALPDVMGRNLDKSAFREIDRLERYLRLPHVVLWLLVHLKKLWN